MLDAGQGLRDLALESNEDAGRVLVGTVADVARVTGRLLEDLTGALLRQPNELPPSSMWAACSWARDDRVALLARMLNDPSGLPVMRCAWRTSSGMATRI